MADDPPDPYRIGQVSALPSPEIVPGRDKSTRPLGIVLIDTPHVVRAGIKFLVAAQSDMEVLIDVGTADECLSELQRIRRRTRIAVLVGLGLRGDHDSYWLIRSIRERFPPMPVIACGLDSDEGAISKALFMGADSFVDKNAQPPEFLDAIRRTARGEIVLIGVPESWLGRIADGLERRGGIEDQLLTERELEVLSVATQGLTARQIGNRLGVRERTVTTHLSRIYKKLGAGGRVAAIHRAAQSGLVSVGSSRH
jgi:DNA-binding NarL/FixJ family response regulator